MEKQVISLNGKDISLVLRRHKAARRITIRVNPAGDGVVMTLPMRGSMTRAMNFLHQKAGWVLSHVKLDAAKVRFTEEVTLPVLGQNVTIERLPGRGLTRLEGGKLYVHGAEEFTARRVKDFLKKEIQVYCLAQAKQMAERLGKTVRSVRVGDMRSRWGSCNASGALAFNWRLIFAPQYVLDYLIAHEVAHLAQMNHSPRFWAYVAELYPDYKMARQWLRCEGQVLYRYE